jgi:hypothetical protein
MNHEYISIITSSRRHLFRRGSVIEISHLLNKPETIFVRIEGDYSEDPGLLLTFPNAESAAEATTKLTS